MLGFLNRCNLLTTKVVEATGVEPFWLIDSTEVIAITHSQDSLNLLKWAIHYTSITRESFT